MHLLAAQPGGFTDDEGIIDLQQTPADMVFMSAADSALAAVANTADGLPDDFPSLRLANWMQLLKPAALDLYADKVLDHARVVVVSFLGGSAYWRYGFEQLVAWSTAKPGRVLVLVPGDDAHDPELFAASTVAQDDAMRIWRYLRQGGALNIQQLLLFLGARFAQRDYQWREPEALPHCMMYMPADPHIDRSARHNGQASLAEWQQRWQQSFQSFSERSSQSSPQSSSQKSDDSAVPVCVLLFYRSHLQSANTAMFDTFIGVLEQQGLRPLPIAITSLKDAESIALVNALATEAQAALIINTTGFSSNRCNAPDLSSQPSDFVSPFTQDIPVLQVVLSSSTEADWQSHAQGLRSRDIAMQVVLPEMDGRVLTRAISFKTEAYYAEHFEISVVRYGLCEERARFVAQLAKKYCRLASQPNDQKRIALILANYPTKDGRIGNGVGLDTPESTCHLLRALAHEGYPVTDIPESGTALIKELLGAVTNNPNTLHQLPCWQSLDIDTYWQHFKRLPQVSQQAVLQQWGEPQQDPKYRKGRLMLAGIRLGETFIGIQPARGFNQDLLANYHDPDLVPPHSYLAFYFWLRHCYQVDALVHVGKHGNLEWLPGKGLALSDTCWPDIALGPMPHFYPFIVNDPGEGAQAKRRTQAVIIDHLMPPMTRAEVYGELAELEGLVDEYYQAMGMDTRREQWLRERILTAVKTSNVLQELGCDAQSDTETVFAGLDTYLCDIKEAQIRHGLHILGALPDNPKQADTLVALLRLPRGSDPVNQGLLHNLASDFGLFQGSEPYDPMSAEVVDWLGDKPQVLHNLTDSVWRTTADTRERLELYALELVESYVLGDHSIDTVSDTLPRTSEQLRYAKNVVQKALQRSVHNEIQALVKGLNGHFVEPGPSGAPTRGRLDVLPTGRNFFSVDNRSIPSQAAWAIGQRSADALIARHLQEQGDFPRDLGLSVWGTATMRTGGDDIAQAFALMGIKPLWAPGSQRVVDFEIIPTQLLNRPRVDVTLRVSGFFRDAFPNVMALYDAAIIALASYDDPGGYNTIKNNIKDRQQTLIDSGVEPDQALRQASYRVFGSKPGAYGAGLQGLIDERCWETRSDLAEAYVNWGGYAYGSDKQSRQGVSAHTDFEQRLGALQSVVQNQDNREHDLLDSDDYYQFQGGMTNAVANFSGVEPIVYHNDHSNPAAPKVRTLKEELNRVVRSRLLNPKWITAMREHGYKGAFEMAASVDYLFAYDATTNLIDDYQYERVADALIFDQENQRFMHDNNPSALEEMAERMLEAVQRGLWQEPGDYAEQLQNLLIDMDAQQEGGK